MVKVITQETFDAVVKENIEEFGLDVEEATKDAIDQFKAQVRIAVGLHVWLTLSLILLLQGVSLSNIVTDSHKNDNASHLIVEALDSIDKLLQPEVGQSL